MLPLKSPLSYPIWSASDQSEVSLILWTPLPVFLGFPDSSAGKESACNAGDLGLIPTLGRFPGEGNGYPLQCSGLENSIDCVARGVAEARPSDSLSWYLVRAGVCVWGGGGGGVVCPITWSCSALTPADGASAQLEVIGQDSLTCLCMSTPS